jgi:hypothetical protein
MLEVHRSSTKPWPAAGRTLGKFARGNVHVNAGIPVFRHGLSGKLIQGYGVSRCYEQPGHPGTSQGDATGAFARSLSVGGMLSYRAGGILQAGPQDLLAASV